jgi:NAD(P)-dependent dehydrogenase (short-subunit alcohol dehydrogenase family)
LGDRVTRDYIDRSPAVEDAERADRQQRDDRGEQIVPIASAGGIIDRSGAQAQVRKSPGTFDLTNEIAVVTGSTGRLGRIWIKALRDAGATVWGTDTEATMNGSPFKGIQAGHADITSEREVRALFQLVTATSGHAPTILVNNAGVDSRPSMTDYDAMAGAMARVNLLGTDLMTRIFGAAMAEAGKGSIINIASLYGLVVPDLRYYDHREDGWVKDPMYGATKAGVIQLTRYYAAKWAASGVRVNALAPGGVVAGSDGLTAQDPQFAEKYTSRIPMKRMCTPEDLSGPLVFLASEAASFVTGQTIALDGGYLCW